MVLSFNDSGWYNFMCPEFVIVDTALVLICDPFVNKIYYLIWQSSVRPSANVACTWILKYFLKLDFGEGNGNPLQYSCLENLRDSGAWWAAVYGVTLSRPARQAVSESAIWWENEKQDTRIQRKVRIKGPTPLQGEGAETESKPALLYFQPWMKEYEGS